MNSTSIFKSYFILLFFEKILFMNKKRYKILKKILIKKSLLKKIKKNLNKNIKNKFEYNL
jgi:hypothetical protein